MNLQRSYILFRKGHIYLNTCKYFTSCGSFTKQDSKSYNVPKTEELSSRFVSTCEVKPVTKTEDSLIRKILRKVPFLNVDKTRTRVAAYLIYENIADKVNYLDFFEKLDLPDTFYSWFVITELHIWMLSVRTMAEGDQGRFIRNCLVEALWGDVAQRVKKLGAGSPETMKHHILELSEQLQASLIAYDEGLQSDDTVLAGALWRRMYQHNFADPSHLEQLVRYVRRHVTLLDNLPKDRILEEKSVDWEPLHK